MSDSEYNLNAKSLFQMHEMKVGEGEVLMDAKIRTKLERWRRSL